MSARKTIAVIGAGQGGLSVAGFLQRAGFPVTVYERAPAFSRIGAGIILSTNAMKAFRRLGIEQDLIETGIKPESYVSRAWDSGETMYEIKFDAASEARYGGPYMNIHRGDLHGVLERVVTPGTIAFDHRLVGLDESREAYMFVYALYLVRLEQPFAKEHASVDDVSLFLLNELEDALRRPVQPEDERLKCAAGAAQNS
jgi:6-hydroxynicotinate 3-monooxygenase